MRDLLYLVVKAKISIKKRRDGIEWCLSWYGHNWSKNMFGRAVCCETHFYKLLDKLLALQCINTKQKIQWLHIAYFIAFSCYYIGYGRELCCKYQGQ